MNLWHALFGLSNEERIYTEQLIERLNPEGQTQFLIKYKLKRKKPIIYLMLNFLGFLFIAGFHRFYIRKPLSGLLQFFTLGYFFIGTIVDAMTFISKVQEANIELAEKLCFEVQENQIKFNSNSRRDYIP